MRAEALGLYLAHVDPHVPDTHIAHIIGSNKTTKLKMLKFPNKQNSLKQ